MRYNNELQPKRLARSSQTEATDLRTGQHQEQTSGNAAYLTHHNTRRMEHTEALHESSHIVAATWLKRKNEEIKQAVCQAMISEKHFVGTDDLMQKTRSMEVVFGRSLSTFILWAYYGQGSTAVAKMWKMDHSTVIHQRSSVVNKIEAIGWCGRTYLKVCETLGLEPLNYIHPETITKPVVKYFKTEEGELLVRRPNGTKSQVEGKLTEWTPEQRARMRILRKFPGGVPRDIIERFEKKFKTTL